MTPTSTYKSLLRDHQRERALLNSVLNTTDAMLVYLDPDFSFVWVNEAYARACQYLPHELIGKNHFALFPNAENHIIFRTVRDTGQPVRFRDKAFEFPDQPDCGVTYWNWSLVADKDEKGQVVGLVLSLSETTEQVCAQQALRANITARELTEDALRVAKAEAESADRAKSRFLAAASHDLRQPLAALSLYVGALENKLESTHGKVLEQMRLCVANLGEMLSDLLDLSRLEAGAVLPKISDFSLDTIFARLESTHAPEARRKGLSLRVRGSTCIGRTDPILFQRIVGNLIENAIRYTERGGVLVACRRRDGRTWVEVWDTGIGVPADKTEVIFEEFRQLGNEERNHSKGTGLGLAIVAKCAALQGLRIRVKSRPGRGSVFAVELPPGAAIVPEVQGQAHRNRPLRIAVLEDNAEVADALTCYLTASGHEVVVADACSALISQLGERPPDIVVSDYRLGGGATGTDAIVSLRAKYGDMLPAIIVTGDTDPKLIRAASEQRLRLHYKPLALDLLRAALAELTDQEPGPCWLPESC